MHSFSNISRHRDFPEIRQLQPRQVGELTRLAEVGLCNDVAIAVVPWVAAIVAISVASAALAQDWTTHDVEWTIQTTTPSTELVKDVGDVEWHGLAYMPANQSLALIGLMDESREFVGLTYDIATQAGSRWRIPSTIRPFVSQIGLSATASAVFLSSREPPPDQDGIETEWLAIWKYDVVANQWTEVLNQSPRLAAYPSVSPDGTMMAVHFLTEKCWEIRRLDGGDLVSAVHDIDGNPSGFSWADSGSAVLTGRGAGAAADKSCGAWLWKAHAADDVHCLLDGWSLNQAVRCGDMLVFAGRSRDPVGRAEWNEGVWMVPFVDGERDGQLQRLGNAAAFLPFRYGSAHNRVICLDMHGVKVFDPRNRTIGTVEWPEPIIGATLVEDEDRLTLWILAPSGVSSIVLSN